MVSTAISWKSEMMPIRWASIIARRKPRLFMSSSAERMVGGLGGGGAGSGAGEGWARGGGGGGRGPRPGGGRMGGHFPPLPLGQGLDLGLQPALPGIGAGALGDGRLRRAGPEDRGPNGRQGGIAAHEDIVRRPIGRQDLTVLRPATRESDTLLANSERVGHDEPRGALDGTDADVTGGEEVDHRVPGLAHGGGDEARVARGRRRWGFVRATAGEQDADDSGDAQLHSSLTSPRPPKPTPRCPARPAPLGGGRMHSPGSSGSRE